MVRFGIELWRNVTFADGREARLAVPDEEFVRAARPAGSPMKSNQSSKGYS